MTKHIRITVQIIYQAHSWLPSIFPLCLPTSVSSKLQQEPPSSCKTIQNVHDGICSPLLYTLTVQDNRFLQSIQPVASSRQLYSHNAKRLSKPVLPKQHKIGIYI